MFRKEIDQRLDAFLSKNLADQVAILFSIYVFTFLVGTGVNYNFFVNILPVFLFVTMLIGFRAHIFSVKFWLVTTLLIGYGVLRDWDVVSNHQYVMTYFGLALIFTYSQPEDLRGPYIKRQSKYIFILVMFFAGMQKLLAPGYADGSVLEFMFLRGRAASFIMDYFFADETATNQRLIDEFGKSFSENRTIHFAWHSPFFHNLVRPLAGLIIISEILIGVCAFWFFNKRAFQIIIVAFAVGIFIVTPEGGFLSLLLILSWSQLPKKQTFVHKLYLFCLMLILALWITRISLS